MKCSRHLAVASVLMVFAACSTGRTHSATSSDRDILTADEIEAANMANTASAYDIIKRLRGNFLSYRGKTSLNNTSSPDPVVYVDDQAYGLIPSLRNIPAGQIAWIRLYRSWEATTKFGAGNMGGVIAIGTKQ